MVPGEAEEIEPGQDDAGTIEVTEVPEDAPKAVDLSPQEGGEDGEAQDKPRRKARPNKDNRWNEMVAKTQEATRRADELAHRLEEQDRRLKELSEKQQPAQDDIERQLAEVRQEMNHHLAVAGNENSPPEMAKAALDRYNALQEVRIDLITEKKLRGRQPAQQINPARELLAADYPWINSNESAANAAAATYGYLVHVERRPPGLATEREACARVAAKMGLGGKTTSAPSPEQRARYEGVPNRDAAPRQGDKITLTSQERDWVRQANPRASEKEIGDFERTLAKRIWTEDPDRRHD